MDNHQLLWPCLFPHTRCLVSPPPGEPLQKRGVCDWGLSLSHGVAAAAVAVVAVAVVAIVAGRRWPMSTDHWQGAFRMLRRAGSAAVSTDPNELLLCGGSAIKNDIGLHDPGAIVESRQSTGT